ncbi:MAG: hypothetical protein N3A61_08595, partial [Ignavibacteria bacterium]|nr:hypothetical protein [Ignavibacteria bacterium]
MVHTAKENEPFYEIVFKAGVLKQVFDDGLMLLTSYKNRDIEIYIPFTSIKCVDIIHPPKNNN